MATVEAMKMQNVLHSHRDGGVAALLAEPHCDAIDLNLGCPQKRAREGLYGAYLRACYNDVDEEYQCICKIGTGFSDEALQRSKFKANGISVNLTG